MPVEGRETTVSGVAYLASPWLWTRRGITALGVVIFGVLVWWTIAFVLGDDFTLARGVAELVGLGLYWLIFVRPYVRSVRKWRALHS